MSTKSNDPFNGTAVILSRNDPYITRGSTDFVE